MEATYSSETSAEFQRTTRRYNPEEWTVHIHSCENFKSCIIKIMFIIWFSIMVYHYETDSFSSGFSHYN
jgi:hypothetical protein